MQVLLVLIQHAKASLDRPFTYLNPGKEKAKIGCRVLIRFNNQLLMGYVVDESETELDPAEFAANNGYVARPIERIVDEEPLLSKELMTLVDEVSAYYLCPRISVLQTMLPQSLKPSFSSLRGPKIAYEDWIELVDGNEEGLTPKQKELIRYLAAHSPILKKEAGSPDIVKRLVLQGKIRLFKKEKARFVIPESQKEREPKELSLDQKNAVKTIYESSKEVVLLQGVTGSGKTEVYLKLSERYLNDGKNILMLVPEISLTPIMVEYFSSRFKGNVAILHSGLTPAEKYDEYRRIARGEARVVVGARSAVFAPLGNIGLIILDEEHVESYKQDTLPYYHAREVAIMRARHFGAKVVLGSATPSLETKARALRGVYGISLLPKRVNEKALPKTNILDLTNRKIMMPGDRVFSKILLDAIKERLDKKEQAILLLNRRGYSSLVTCAHCGKNFTCPTCQCNLTYHKEDGLLKCHHCGYVEEYPEVCPNCGSERIQRIGFGTERAVKVLNEYFPEAKIGRLDSDIGKARANIAKTLQEFREGAYDILVGTQMIAKGHDFPNVTLVGVALADIGLGLPSYRASESTFELIAQAVGRSGRGAKTGEAIIQAYNPRHYAISLGAKQDYEAFFTKEMQQRKISAYPPYVYMIAAIFAAKDEEKCVEACFNVKEEIERRFEKEVIAIGPVSPYYEFVGGSHRRVLLIKTKKPDDIKPFLSDLSHRLSGKNGVDIIYDVDPLDY